jgi:phosphoribosyl-AMP cyclohydrolase
MPAGMTYTPIATTTLSSAASSTVFTSIPSTYTDLVVVVNSTFTTASSRYISLQFNSDTSSNYSMTYMLGSGSSVVSSSATADTSARIGNGSTTIINSATTVAHILNYANSTTYKTTIGRSSGDSYAISYVSLWRGSTGSATQAISSVTVTCDTTSSNTFGVGSTFTLYGIRAA